MLGLETSGKGLLEVVIEIESVYQKVMVNQNADETDAIRQLDVMPLLINDILGQFWGRL